MRKLMALTAIGIITAAAQPSWALLGLENVNFDGSLEVSGISANNEVDFGNDPDVPGISGTGTSNDHRGRTATRVRVGMNSMVTEGVKGRIELIRDTRQYGDANGPTNVTTEEGLWRVHNAYVEIENLWDHMFRLGRQYVGNPGDLVWNISPTDDDALTNNSIDGLLVQCRKYDFIHADFFTGKAQENDTLAAGTTDTDQGDSSSTDSDVNLTSLDFTFPKLVPGAMVNLGYLLGDNANSQAENDNNHLRTLRVGINGGVNENMFTYRAEFFQNMGTFNGQGTDGSGNPTDLDYKGNAIDLGAGINMNETPVGGVSGWINYIMASGDDDVADDQDDSFHDFSVVGFNTSDRLLGEIFGKSNTLAGGSIPLGQGVNSADSTGSAPNGSTQGQGIMVFNIGASLKPKFSEKSTFKVDFYTFNQAEDSVRTGVGTTATLKDDIGTELDLAYMYDHSANVGVELGYAMLSPGEALTGGSPNKDDAVTKLYARTKIKWGGEAQ